MGTAALWALSRAFASPARVSKSLTIKALLRPEMPVIGFGLVDIVVCDKPLLDNAVGLEGILEFDD